MLPAIYDVAQRNMTMTADSRSALRVVRALGLGDDLECVENTRGAAGGQEKRKGDEESEGVTSSGRKSFREFTPTIPFRSNHTTMLINSITGALGRARTHSESSPTGA